MDDQREDRYQTTLMPKTRNLSIIEADLCGHYESHKHDVLGRWLLWDSHQLYNVLNSMETWTSKHGRHPPFIAMFLFQLDAFRPDVAPSYQANVVPSLRSLLSQATCQTLLTLT